mgnify:CR=1 FL=1
MTSVTVLFLFQYPDAGFYPAAGDLQDLFPLCPAGIVHARGPAGQRPVLRPSATQADVVPEKFHRVTPGYTGGLGGGLFYGGHHAVQVIFCHYLVFIKFLLFLPVDGGNTSGGLNSSGSRT